MVYKLLILTLSLLFLTYSLAANEIGTLYLKKVNGKIGWFESGDAKKHLKYVGEIDEGKPNGTGELISPSGKYSGEFKMDSCMVKLFMSIKMVKREKESLKKASRGM